MITFKQFLSEARMAPLYHGTLPHKAVKILGSNTLMDNTGQFIRTDKNVDKERQSYSLIDVHMNGASLTRSFKFAYDYVDSSAAVVFELDQQKITYNNKIIPYSYWSRGGKGPGRTMDKIGKFNPFNEHEEFVIGPIKNIESKTIKIHANPRYIQNYPTLYDHPKLFWKDRFVNR